MTAASWTARVLTLFPEMFPGMLGYSLAGRALRRGHWSLEAIDIRSFAGDRHRTVDDAPLGGGAGMVMRPDVVDDALCFAKGGAAEDDPVRPAADRVLFLTPRGRLFDQALARELAGVRTVALMCGRYEGVDQRVLEAHAVEEVSLGDFVLSGGEPAAACVLDAVVRLLPGVMGNDASGEEESFSAGLLEYPQYTRPAVWTGRDGVARAAPDVLLSGHHSRIGAWRLAEAERITRERRPDLWRRYRATASADAV